MRKLDTPVSTKTVSSKPSRVDFDVLLINLLNNNLPALQKLK